MFSIFIKAKLSLGFFPPLIRGSVLEMRKKSNSSPFLLFFLGPPPSLRRQNLQTDLESVIEISPTPFTVIWPV